MTAAKSAFEPFHEIHLARDCIVTIEGTWLSPLGTLSEVWIGLNLSDLPTSDADIGPRPREVVTIAIDCESHDRWNVRPHAVRIER